MNLSIRHYTVPEVHAQPLLLESLANLTVPVVGTMRRHLEDTSGDLSKKHVWVARDNQEIVGWALRFPSIDVDNLCYYHFYTKPEFRRQGIATILAEVANRSAEENTLYRTAGWTEKSKSFFLSLRQKHLITNLEIVHL